MYNNKQKNLPLCSLHSNCQSRKEKKLLKRNISCMNTFFFFSVYISFTSTSSISMQISLSNRAHSLFTALFIHYVISVRFSLALDSLYITELRRHYSSGKRGSQHVKPYGKFLQFFPFKKSFVFNIWTDDWRQYRQTFYILTEEQRVNKYLHLSL